MTVRERLGRWLALPGAVTSTYSRVCDVHADLRELLRRPSPVLPAPFICALAEADSDRGPTTLGASGRVLRDGTVLELRTQLPLRNVRLTVFCDLERVSIHGLFIGSDLVTAALGECPVATFAEWHPGVLVRVQCMLRRD